MSVVEKRVSHVDALNRIWGLFEAGFIIGLWVITLPYAIVDKVHDFKRKVK